MTRKILKGIAGFFVLIGIAVSAFVLYAGRRWDAPVDAPLPPIQADRSPTGVARGAAIFHSTCEVCHRAPGSERASGAPVTDAPAFLGSFYSVNITAHPTAGIGKYSDAELARLVRYGVTRNGHRSVMPTYGMGDADVAALLGFLRSDDPLVHADAKASPPSRLSALGKAVLMLAGAAEVPDAPRAALSCLRKNLRRHTAVTSRSPSSTASAVTLRGSARKIPRPKTPSPAASSSRIRAAAP